MPMALLGVNLFLTARDNTFISQTSYRFLPT